MRHPSELIRERARGNPDAVREGHVAVVVSRWNELVTRELKHGALDEIAVLAPHLVVEVFEVPGAWEIPLVVRAALEAQPAAVVALGCILQGQTPHAAQLAAQVGSALMSLQLDSGIPIAWGILTPDTAEQALDRAGLKLGNKGREAAQAALEMAGLLHELRHG
jgi:6,7-dimethyl-8-ribityllumazine synthase